MPKTPKPQNPKTPWALKLKWYIRQGNNAIFNLKINFLTYDFNGNRTWSPAISVSLIVFHLPISLRSCSDWASHRSFRTGPWLYGGLYLQSRGSRSLCGASKASSAAYINPSRPLWEGVFVRLERSISSTFWLLYLSNTLLAINSIACHVPRAYEKRSCHLSQACWERNKFTSFLCLVISDRLKTWWHRLSLSSQPVRLR